MAVARDGLRTMLRTQVSTMQYEYWVVLIWYVLIMLPVMTHRFPRSVPAEGR